MNIKKNMKKIFAVILSLAVIFTTVINSGSIYASEPVEAGKLMLKVNVTDEQGQKIENTNISFTSDVRASRYNLEPFEAEKRGEEYVLLKDRVEYPGRSANYQMTVAAEGYETFVTKKFRYNVSNDYFTKSEGTAGRVTINVTLVRKEDKLANFKKAAIEEIKSYKNINEYDDEDKSAVSAAIAETEQSINAAGSEDDVTSAKNEGKKKLDSIKTRAEKEAWTDQQRIFFRHEDGREVAISRDGSFTLRGIDKGKFFVRDYSGDVKWTSQNNYRIDEHHATDILITVDGTFEGKINANNVPANVVLKGEGSKKIEFKINLVPSNITELKVLVDDVEITSDKKLEVQGSEWKIARVFGKIGENWEAVPAKAVKFSSATAEIRPASGGFSMYNPGEGSLTCALEENKSIKKTITINSTYVPVQEVKVSVPEKWYIHGWNGLGGYYSGIISGDVEGDGKNHKHRVTILPANASNKKVVWKALTPDIANYMVAFDNGIIPEKNGIAKFVISSVDNPEIKTEVAVELDYKYPMISAKPKEKVVPMTPGSRKTLEFDIQPGNASEQRFRWSFDKSGIANIASTIAHDPGDVESRWAVHTLNAWTPGVVTATGVPYDKSRNSENLVFKILVSNNPEADMTAAKKVDDLIKNIEVLEGMDAVEKTFEVRDALDLLSPIQKDLLENRSIFEEAEANIEAVKKAEAEAITKLIGDIGDVTFASKAAIDKAAEKFNKFTELFGADTGLIEKSLIEKLEAASQKYEELVENAVKSVTDMIDNLGEVEDVSKEEAVKSAREAYDSLNQEQKQAIKNVDKLIAAEAKMSDIIQKEADKIEELIRALPNKINMLAENQLKNINQILDKLPNSVKALIENKDILDKANDKYDAITSKATIPLMELEVSNKDKDVRVVENGISFKAGEATSGGILKFDGEFSTFENVKFGKVTVDGKTLKIGRDYTAKEGSIVIEFDKSFLNSLSAGTHVARVYTTEGYGEGKIEVIGKKPSNANNKGEIAKTSGNQKSAPGAKTGDYRSMTASMSLLLISVGMICMISIKKRNSRR